MDSNSDIRNLRVTHWSPRTPVRPASGAGFFVDTCLRQVYIEVMPAALAHDGLPGNSSAPAERKSGTDAYELLLEIMTGLRSAVPGETNVFGQFKDAWQAFRRDGHAATVARLAPLMHRLINDTKNIRSEHLQGIGGASYGSLVRRLITPGPDDRILFVGAGNLAQSMLPFFRQFEVGLWNRSPTMEQPETVDHFFRPEHGRRAAQWADHVILTTPPDASHDRQWRGWVEASAINTPVRTVVHLGHRSGPNRVGAPFSRDRDIKTYFLEDVFALRQAQAGRRSNQLAHARAACRKRARNSIAGEHKSEFVRLKTA
jgi:hypothetical protein